MSFLLGLPSFRGYLKFQGCMFIVFFGGVGIWIPWLNYCPKTIPFWRNVVWHNRWWLLGSKWFKVTAFPEPLKTSLEKPLWINTQRIARLVWETIFFRMIWARTMNTAPPPKKKKNLQGCHGGHILHHCQQPQASLVQSKDMRFDTVDGRNPKRPPGM